VFCGEKAKNEKGPPRRRAGAAVLFPCMAAGGGADILSGPAEWLFLSGGKIGGMFLYSPA